MNNFESTLLILDEGGQEKKGVLVKSYKGFDIHEVPINQIHPTQRDKPFYAYETIAGYTHLMFYTDTLKSAKKKVDEWLVRREVEKKEREEREAQERIERENRIANREKEGYSSVPSRDSGVNRWGQGRNAVRGSGNGGSGLMWK